MTPAQRLAQKVPLVHFPANAVVKTWSSWGSFLPKAHVGGSKPKDYFERLEFQHVFLYAGPCCYALKPGAIGDSARLGWGFVLLSSLEYKYAREIERLINESAPKLARALVAVLLGKTPEQFPGFHKFENGMLVGYCDHGSASWVRGRIRMLAMQQMKRAIHSGNHLETVAWWLQRSAIEQREYLFAAAALKQGGNPAWATVANAMHQMDMIQTEEEVEKIRLWLTSSDETEVMTFDSNWRECQHAPDDAFRRSEGTVGIFMGGGGTDTESVIEPPPPRCLR